MNYTYLFVNLACIAIPIIASFYNKRKFYKQWNRFFLSSTIVAIPFLIWDEIFTLQGVWGFNDDYIIGLRIGNLPLEEIMFFYCIPFACVFTYFALSFLIKRNPLHKIDRYISMILCLVSIVFIVLSDGGLYSLFTGSFTLIFLIIVLYKKISLSYVYLTYICIYPFFLISNGILTGSGLADPIVWYDDCHNLGIRIFTIPIEDNIYGFLLIAMNILVFKKVKIVS